MDEEGLRWKRQESWFRESASRDPAFAENGGCNRRLCLSAAPNAHNLR
jgi:hypothetical protein